MPHDDPASVVAAAREEGVLVSAVGPAALRLVTHLDVSADAAARAATVDSNIVVVPMADPTRVVTAAREEGVLLSAVGATSLRMVTHLDVSRTQTETAASVLRKVLA